MTGRRRAGAAKDGGAVPLRRTVDALHDASRRPLWVQPRARWVRAREVSAGGRCGAALSSVWRSNRVAPDVRLHFRGQLV
jgi:hypothetical protein